MLSNENEPFQKIYKYFKKISTHPGGGNCMSKMIYLNSSQDKKRIAVVRNELVDLTGDHISAMILNQLLYWTQRVKDTDLMREEDLYFKADHNTHFRHGWIYKTAEELNEEIMIKSHKATVLRYLKSL